MRSVLAAIFLIGCSMNEPENPGAAVAMDQGRWQLVEVDGNPVAAGGQGWLEVDMGQARITGSSGCNEFMVAFEGSPEALVMGAVGGTKKLCPEPLMAQERRVYEILSAARSMTVDGDGMLRISGARGYLRAEPAT